MSVTIPRIAYASAEPMKPTAVTLLLAARPTAGASAPYFSSHLGQTAVR